MWGFTRLYSSDSPPTPRRTKPSRGGDGVDKGIDAVGYQAIAPGKETEAPTTVLDALVQIVNATGMLGIPGLYVPTDPGGVDPHAQQGRLLIPFGKLFEKGLRLGTGQCNVKRYNRYRMLLAAGLLLGDLPQAHGALSFEGTDTPSGDDHRLARIGRDRRQVGFLRGPPWLGCCQGHAQLAGSRHRHATQSPGSTPAYTPHCSLADQAAG